jgi:hypothetical protein
VQDCLVKTWLAAAAIAFVVTSVVYMPVCDMVFDCGCTWPWLGGVQHCNIHVAGPPDCPLCKGGAPVQALGFAAMGTPIFLVSWGGLKALAKLMHRGATRR